MNWGQRGMPKGKGGVNDFVTRWERRQGDIKKHTALSFTVHEMRLSS